MKLVIPMSGHGSRFKAAGYPDLKPLIVVDGKPIIAHVLDMFPGEDDVIFICNEAHLTDPTLRMEEILHELRPSAQIISVASHRKGPVHDTTAAFPYIGDDEDVMISYCDFTQRWDYADFKKQVRERNAAGAVPAYTGFHPHLLHRNLYGGMLVDENNLLRDYKEKFSFTENPEDSHHSGGAYYFASGELLKRYSTELLQMDIAINGEFYTSMIYYLLLRDNLPIYVPEASHFMQWGTPEDLEEYEAWSTIIHAALGKDKPSTAIPESRRDSVAIKHPEDSEEYQKSYAYWLTCHSHV